MNNRLYTATDVTAASLRHALQDRRLTWVYAERMENTVLDWRVEWLKLPGAPERWTHGRAFGPDLELRWEQRQDGFEVRVITNGCAPPDGLSLAEVPFNLTADEDEQQLLLIGERDRDRPSDRPTWSAARIPCYLAYPADDSAARVALAQRVYRQNGQVIATRLLRVKEAADA